MAKERFTFSVHLQDTLEYLSTSRPWQEKSPVPIYAWPNLVRVHAFFSYVAYICNFKAHTMVSASRYAKYCSKYKFNAQIIVRASQYGKYC